MFDKLSHIFDGKFKPQDELSRHLEIVKVFDLYKQELTKLFPAQNLPQLVSLKNGQLLIRTKSPAQAASLRLREAEATAAVNRKLGRQIIRRVVYRF